MSRVLRLLALVSPVVMMLVFSCSNDAAQHTSSKTQTSPAVSTTEQQDFERYLPLTPDIKPPKATYAPDPPFPSLPPNAEDDGHVMLQVGINAKGRVEAVRVLRNDLEAFEKSAIATVKMWRFKPAEKDGEPVPVQISVQMNFHR